MRKSGETIVIGGVQKSSKTVGEAGVPYLSDLPIIGALFRRTTSAEDRNDVLIMVTPKIINNQSPMSSDQGVTTVNSTDSMPSFDSEVARLTSDNAESNTQSNYSNNTNVEQANNYSEDESDEYESDEEFENVSNNSYEEEE
jgi:Flp pilus assembly secretin CpaC